MVDHPSAPDLRVIVYLVELFGIKRVNIGLSVIILVFQVFVTVVLMRRGYSDWYIIPLGLVWVAPVIYYDHLMRGTKEHLRRRAHLEHVLRGLARRLETMVDEKSNSTTKEKP